MKYITIFLVLSAFQSLPSMIMAESRDESIHLARLTPPVKYDNVIETVMVNNERYQVPEPWAGNRLFPTSRNLDELHMIPLEYTFNGSEVYILEEAYDSFLAMVTQAHEDGIKLQAKSGYRSIQYQTRIFERRMEQGHTFDDIVRYVAPPGYSQHMLGTAIDFHPNSWQFAESDQYLWLQEHAHEFGFAETYSRYNRYNISWEAWHWNFVGVPEKEMTAEVEIPVELPPDDQVETTAEVGIVPDDQEVVTE